VLISRAFRGKPQQEPADGISGAAGPARPPLAAEALALAVVIAGATALSRSCLLYGGQPTPAPPGRPRPDQQRAPPPSAAGRRGPT
jgi:hypothetical protein